MKKLSLYIFLVFIWCNAGFTIDINKLEDLEIDGINIGDNLLDHFSKQELIQNKKLLKADMVNRKLYYTSITTKGTLGTFHYESNEKVGMTEKPIYRIIGMTLRKKCDENLLGVVTSKDKSLKLFQTCVDNYFEKKQVEFDETLLGLLNLYFDKKTVPEIEETENFVKYVDNAKLGSACYNDQVDIVISSFLSHKLVDEEFWFLPSINITLMSSELEQILYTKYC